LQHGIQASLHLSISTNSSEHNEQAALSLAASAEQLGRCLIKKGSFMGLAQA
jgi:hypothetical protein